MDTPGLTKDSTVVITGGGGFVGRHLIAELKKTYPELNIVVWERNITNLPEGVKGESVDITEPSSYITSLETLQPAWVIHLAAVAAIGAAAKDPDMANRVNVEATEVLLQNIESFSPATHVLVTSSADIYGGTDIAKSGTPIPELSLTETRPTNPYAETKQHMEEIIEKTYNDRCIRVRPFPHIGPGQGLGFVTADFASQVAAIEKGKQEPVMKVGNLEAERDFTDVRDTVRSYRLLLEQGQLGEVYNVASGKGTKIQWILDQLLSNSTTDITVEQDPDRMRPSDVPRMVGDVSKLTKQTGWQPSVDLTKTLQDILDYWRNIT